MQSLLSQPSSLPEYLGQRKTEWVHPEEILAYFSKSNPQLDYSKKSSAYSQNSEPQQAASKKSSAYLSFVQQTDDYSSIHKALIDEI